MLYRKFLSNKHKVHQTIPRLDQYSVWIIYYHWLYVPVFPSYILKAMLLFSYFAAHFIRAIDITCRDLRTNLSSQVNLTEFMLYIIVVPFLTSDYISSIFYFQIGCLSINISEHISYILIYFIYTLYQYIFFEKILRLDFHVR